MILAQPIKILNENISFIIKNEQPLDKSSPSGLQGDSDKIIKNFSKLSWNCLVNCPGII